MKAAVVSSFDTAPRYEEFPIPDADAPHALLVDVLAAGLHPRVLAQADGSHYTSTDELPLVPGIDGVGRGRDGVLRYFVLPDTALGAMAEQTVIDTRRSILLPEGCDPVMIAAAMNPAMASWIALRQRTQFPAGANVLVLGATGSAGQMAVQVARLFGAGQVIAVGRDAAKLAALPALGATATVLLDADDAASAGRLADAAADVDVVLDYLWGTPTSAAMTTLATHRADPHRPLTWIEIGSVAGSTTEIPSAAFRSIPLQLVGSGQGSVSARDILAVLPALVQEIIAGTFTVDVRPVPLADVEQAWADAPRSSQRIVLVP